MFRIDDPSAAEALPTPGTAGTPGYFTGGNPVAGTPATIVSADFLNMLQEEMMSVVIAAGLTPSKTAFDQFLTALRSEGVFQTADQFDTSTKVATMEALQRALGSKAGVRIVSATGALTAADVGRVILVNSATAVTLTLPNIATLPPGATFYIQCGATTPSVTVTNPSGDIAAPNGSFVPSQSLTLRSGVASEFIVLTAATVLAAGGGGTGLLTAAGYQRFSNGLILQWNSISVAANTSTLLNFPIAFPNAGLAIVGSRRADGSNTAFNFSISSATQLRAQNTAGGTETAHYIAIGH